MSVYKQDESEKQAYDNPTIKSRLNEFNDIEENDNDEIEISISSKLLEEKEIPSDENENLQGNELADEDVEELELVGRKGDGNPWLHKIRRIALMNWTKDDPPMVRCGFCPHTVYTKLLRLDIDELIRDPQEPSPLFESPEIMKFVKFFSCTLVLITCTYKFVRAVNFEYDRNFTLSDFFLYELTFVTLDMLAYFLIGRLFLRKGVDRLFPCLIPMISGCIFPSWINQWNFFQYSFSMFEIMCRWPFQLFLAIAIALIVVFALIFFHIRTYYCQGVLFSRAVELIIILAVFLLPHANDPNFHIHHWYVAWLIGMLASANTPWSIATLCFAWGYYINGIAVYGRDPILGCKYSFYYSTNMNCKYMQCFVDYNITGNTTNNTVYLNFIPPDWRECTEGYYAY